MSKSHFEKLQISWNLVFQTFWLLYRVLGCRGGSGRPVGFGWCMFRPILRPWGRVMTIFYENYFLLFSSLHLSIKKLVSRPQEVSPGRISSRRNRRSRPKWRRTSSRDENGWVYENYTFSKYKNGHNSAPLPQIWTKHTPNSSHWPPGTSQTD